MRSGLRAVPLPTPNFADCPTQRTKRKKGREKRPFSSLCRDPCLRKGAEGSAWWASAFQIEIVSLTDPIHHKGLQLRHGAVFELAHTFL